MTSEDKQQIEEVRGRLLAFKHWYNVLPKEQPGSYEDTQGPDLEFILSKLDEAHEALRFYADSFAIMDHIDGTYEIRNTWYEKARKALGEE